MDEKLAIKYYKNKKFAKISKNEKKKSNQS